MSSKRNQQGKQKSPQKPSPAQPKTPDSHRDKQGSVKMPGKWVVFSVCLLISFVFYGNTLSNGYSMDDELVTLNQKNVEQGFAGIPAIFASHYSVNSKQNYEYRPVVITSFAIEYQFFGRNPGASHFFNVLIYALTAFLIYSTLLRLFPDWHWSLPVLTMFIFLVHPIHSEVVASLKNRDEMLALIFALLSLRAFLNFMDRKKAVLILLGMCFFILAVFSKKSCVPYFFVIPFTMIYLRKTNPWKIIGFTLGIAAALMVFFALFKGLVMAEKFQTSRETLFFENPLYEGKYGIGQRLLMAIGTFGFYVKMLFAPFPLVAYYGYGAFDGFTFGFYHLVGLAGVLFLLWILVRYFKTNRPLVWGAVLFIAGISMFANLVVPAVGIVAERFAFEASLGFSLMSAVGLLALFKAFQPAGFTQPIPQNLKIIAGVLAIAAAIIVIPRNAAWNNQGSLYRADIVKVPRSAKLNSLLGSYYVQNIVEIKRNPQASNRMMYQTYVDSATYFFTQSVRAYPNYASANNNLATVYINYQHNLDSSIHYFQRAITVDPEYEEALANYAVALEVKADVETQKLDWAKSLPSTSGTKEETEKILENMEVSSKSFALLDQMKTNLVELFNMGVSGQQPAKVAKGIESVTTNYPQQILGTNQPGIDNAMFRQTLLTEYKKLRDTKRFDLAQKVTDSVVNLYFAPSLCRMVGIDLQKGVPAEVKTRLEKKQNEYRQQVYLDCKKSLKLKADNGPLYSRMSMTLVKWGMLDELIALNEMVMKAKNARVQVIELNTAKAYFIKNEFAKGYEHAVKAIETMARNNKRLRNCMADFSAAGNQLSLSYCAQAIQSGQEIINRHVSGFEVVLRQHNMNAEADQLLQRAQQLKNY